MWHRPFGLPRTDINARTARTIAAQLQRGPGSALYAFAVSGAISERLYDELDEAVRRRSRGDQVVRRAEALAGYCLGREETGPVEGWAAEGW